MKWLLAVLLLVLPGCLWGWGRAITPPTVSSHTLATVIWMYPSSKKPSPVMALWLASWIAREFKGNRDLYTMAALSRVESSFRPDAVEGCLNVRGKSTTLVRLSRLRSPIGRKCGPGVGLWQLHATYLPPGLNPFDVRESTPEAKIKLDRMWARHLKEPRAMEPHDFLVHWFAGAGISEGAIVSAAKVRRVAMEMRVMGNKIENSNAIGDGA